MAALGDEAVRPSFASSLKRVMKNRKLDALQVAELVGVSRSTVSTWLAGPLHIPSPAVAARLAKALDAPYLASTAHSERDRTCDFCGTVFEALNRRSVARFCSSPCRTRWWHVKRAQESRERRLDHLSMLRNQVEELTSEKATMKEAIRTHCNRCEPDGVCRDGSCDLREVSPFIFVERKYG